jgi:hypothetical protein
MAWLIDAFGVVGAVIGDMPFLFLFHFLNGIEGA